MRFSTIIPVTLAIGTLAKPIVKRDYITVTKVEVDVVTVIETVVAGEPTMKTNHYDGAYGYQPHSTRTWVSIWTPSPVQPSSTPVYASTHEPASTKVKTKTKAAQPPTASSSSSGSTAGLSNYQAMVMLHHNVHRSNHSVAALSWNETLYNAAHEWASECKYEHNVDVGGGGYGQNIAAGGPANNISGIITEGFYNGEEPFYTYGQADPSNFETVGHFTQIVWKDTVSVACATVECPNGLANIDPNSGIPPIMTVCNYFPPGNWGGKYAVEVKTPIGNPTVHWDYTG